MAIEKIIGTEIELGITAKDASGFDPVSNSILLINSHPAFSRKQWDYARESLLDARSEASRTVKPNQQDNRPQQGLRTAAASTDGAHPEYARAPTPGMSS
jgi:hypothetical protein